MVSQAKQTIDSKESPGWCSTGGTSQIQQHLLGPRYSGTALGSSAYRRLSLADSDDK